MVPDTPHISSPLAPTSSKRPPSAAEDPLSPDVQDASANPSAKTTAVSRFMAPIQPREALRGHYQRVRAARRAFMRRRIRAWASGVPSWKVPNSLSKRHGPVAVVALEVPVVQVVEVVGALHGASPRAGRARSARTPSGSPRWRCCWTTG